MPVFGAQNRLGEGRGVGKLKPCPKSSKHEQRTVTHQAAKRLAVPGTNGPDFNEHPGLLHHKHEAHNFGQAAASAFQAPSL